MTIRAALLSGLTDFDAEETSKRSMAQAQLKAGLSALVTYMHIAAKVRIEPRMAYAACCTNDCVMK